jgi:predicted ester cyclase
MHDVVGALNMQNNASGEIVLRMYNEMTLEARWYNEVGMSDDPFIRFSEAEDYHSLRSFKKYFADIRRAFPDYMLNIDKIVDKGDEVMVRYTISGTQKGDFNGMAPTNEIMYITGIDIFRLSEGKIIMYWNPANQINSAQII